MITIHATDGETEYLTVTVTERTGADLTDTTFEVGLSPTPQTPPTTWQTAAPATTGGPTATVKLLVDDTTPKGKQWLWVRASDEPEVILLECTNQSVTIT